MSADYPERLLVRTRDWADIRAFLVKRQWLRETVGEDVFDMICERNTRQLKGCLMRELSLWVDGYLTTESETK